MPIDRYDDIRPFRDAEVKPAVTQLLDDKRLIRVIGQVKFPFLYRHLPVHLQKLFSLLIRRRLRSRLGKLQTVDDVQDLVFGLMETAITKTTAGVTYSGTEHLQVGKSYLFLSNHRDIAMDPALVNYALKSSGHDYVEIAIGDNLLGDPLVSDVMRLNRSFTVNRSVEGLKARLIAFSRLSAYIGQTLSSGRSIWLAQREGRAKNGLDKTDPAIIKMLHINGKKRGLTFSESIAELHIVPVTISYEYDPCDLLKAEELQARKNAEYLKREGEDIASIIRGITSPKGRVHIGFGQLLTEQYADAEAVAAAVDQQVATQYQLFPSNIVAFEQLQQLSERFSSLQEDSIHKLYDWANQAKNKWLAKDQLEFRRQTAAFSERIARYPETLRHLVLEMYANPLINQHKELVK
jgi:hypothetical protein